jgi:hypothetical protein
LTDVDPTGLFVVVSTVAALTAVKRWLRQYEARTKADVRALAEQHAMRSEELDRRERALTSREQATQRREDTYALRMRSVVESLDTTRAQLWEETAAHAALQEAYDTVRTDYNALIEHCLRDGFNRFTVRATGTCGPLTPSGGHPADDPRLGGSPVAFLHPRQHHPSA